MSLQVTAEPVPLASDADGVVRVGSSRVTLDTVVAAGFHHHLQGLGMGPRHDDHVGGAGLRHHPRFVVATIHDLYVGDDRGNDCDGAKRAGLSAHLLDPSGARLEDLVAACGLAENLVAPIDWGMRSCSRRL